MLAGFSVLSLILVLGIRARPVLGVSAIPGNSVDVEIVDCSLIPATEAVPTGTTSLAPFIAHVGK